MDFSELEQNVLDVFLAENGERYPQLQNQIISASVKSREFTGVGFFATIELPPDTPKIPRNSRFFIGLVCATFKGGAALGFALFVQDGHLETLEGFTYEQGWPANIRDYKLSYHRSTEKIIASDSAPRTSH